MRTKTDWLELEDLPEGLTLAAVAARYKDRARSTVMRQLRKSGYKYADSRKTRQQVDPKWLSIDWQLPVSEIAKSLNVTTTRVREMKAKLAKNAAGDPSNA